MEVDVEKQLRHAAKSSGLSIKGLAKQAELHYASVHGFLNGRSLLPKSMAKLAAALGLELVLRRRRKGGE